MFKSLYSGVSGLSANLTNLDVIGNNIANSNTVGFKSGRVTFNEMLAQTMQSASRPVSGGLGGVNPQQIGLGTRVGSIDTNFNQGNFTTTGNKTDLAIQGNGFFILSDGTSQTYTRAGVFGLDSLNYLVSPSTGLKVQGVMADAAGVIGSGPMEDIYIDPGLVVPARPSSTLQLMGNLDASADAQASVMQSRTFLTAAGGADLLTALNGSTQGPLGLNQGDQVRVNGRTADADLTAGTFAIGADSTYQDLVDWLNAEMAANGHSVAFSLGATGELQVANNGATALDGLSLTVTANTAFNQNMVFDAAIAAAATATTSGLRAYAEGTDTLASLYDAAGNPLGIDFDTGSATLLIGGSVGGETIDQRQVVVGPTTTLSELAQEYQYALGTHSTPAEINATGQMVITGEVGTAAAISEMTLAEDGRINTTLESAFSFAQTQQATDQKAFTVSTTVYDSLGGEHTVSFNFEKVAGMNEWIWQAELEGGEQILSGQSGRVTFSDTGAISSFTYDDQGGAITFRPQATGQEGAAVVSLTVDYGTVGALTGLTQFEGSGNLRSVADGYGAGTLVDYDIDQSGVITGIFSNDTMQTIAQVGLAQFSNPSGLMREANNTYRLSGNSGLAMETFAGLGNGVNLVPGALETSNVDLAKEFTNLVVAQRSFQANSRVITTADQVMQELVNLIR
ncbi:MAG: flagellar hook-basal body complex protein [Krumholzibacteria bacterium]|nr:flagellar hook-basal body complex protein [Candidatus Krumholzibacteria bacterium]